MATNAATRKVQQSAKKEVAEALKRRDKMLRARARALAAIAPAAMKAALPGAPAAKKLALAAPAAAALTKGWIIAEGDSWFDYPGDDILNALHAKGFDIESVARAGDRAEMMAFGRGQLDKFIAAVDKVINAGHVPKAILFSGGGNDMAGKEFGFLINHAGSPHAGLNESVVRGVIDERVRDAYVEIIAKITAVCEARLQQKVPILTHGYGHVIPDGDGVLGGWGPLPGPWLRPGFIEKGFGDLQENTATMKKLIDRFNVMVQGVAAQFAHVKYIDLRPLLKAEKKVWANELHPKPPGFRAAADKFAAAL